MKNETVLFHPETNQFCVMNVTAALLWEELDQPKSERELVAALQEGFELQEGEDISIDVYEVLRELADANCILEIE